MKPRLIASAPTKQDIIKLIARYWCGRAEDISIIDSKVYNHGRLVGGFEVVAAKGRYRFQYNGEAL